MISWANWRERENKLCDFNLQEPIGSEIVEQFLHQLRDYTPLASDKQLLPLDEVLLVT
jgi:hypothetical protein